MTADASIKEIQQILKETALNIKTAFEKAQLDYQKLQDQVEKNNQLLTKRFQETDERFKETDERFKETDIRIKQAFDLFEGQWGKLMESLVEGDLIRLLNARHIEVRDTVTRRKGTFQGQSYEFDIIAHNGDEIVVVEVKTTLRVKHVKRFVNKLAKLKTWIPAYEGYKVYGAIAYLRAEEESEIYTQKQKLFAIRATGDSAAIVNSIDFKPKAF